MNRVLFLLLLCLPVTVMNGQTLSATDTGKYRIDLPSYWRPGNKIWQILSDKLPQVCSELKDKELCGDDCNPKYRIELEMSDLSIMDHIPNHVSSDYRNTPNYRQTDTWEIRTLYYFESSLLLKDETGKILTRFILVDTNEIWSISNRVVLPAYTPPPSNNTAYLANLRRALSRSASGADFSALYNQQAGGATWLVPQTGQEGETPFAYINKHKDQLVPAQRDLLNIIDSKISSW